MRQGGALTLASCALVDDVDAGARAVGLSSWFAGVAFYGIPNTALVDMTKCKRPVSCHFGAKDDIKGFSDLEAPAVLPC